ncbi:MAG: cyclic nucleotide-binding domain-containing protein [Anaerolineales bacterium]|nr:cyclic nucleotide-binding domain-containing protein [Anaerolineales bacterium]
MLGERFVQTTAKSGAVLFQVGDAADGLYLVGKGFVRLFTASGSNLATLGPGSVLGEDSLYRSAPYDVSAHAASDFEYWKLSDQDLRAMIVQYPAIGLKLSQNFGSLIAQMQDYLVQQLSRTSELTGLPRNTLQAIADQLEPRKVAAGQTLYRAGDLAGGLFLIESGRIEVQPDTADGERQEVTDGSLLGALALLTNKPQTTTAVAREETLLWALLADDFQMIASRQPGLRRSLGRNVRPLEPHRPDPGRTASFPDAHFYPTAARHHPGDCTAHGAAAYPGRRTRLSHRRKRRRHVSGRKWRDRADR